ncbi:MAG: hypothetical protein KDE33_01935 [Bacteroidetes bacterium]|nr:hypothetical protein [Bacteroidota bacterium]
MPIVFSKFSKPFEKDDDFFKYNIDNKKKEAIVILCDGVSSSFYGKIAARMISMKSFQYFIKNKSKFLLNPIESFQKLLDSLEIEFKRFYEFVDVYKKFTKSMPYTLLQSQSKENLANLKEKGIVAIKEIKKEREDAIAKRIAYSKLLELDLLPILEKYTPECKDSASTFAFIYIKEVSDSHYFVLSFLLGDFYFIQSFKNENDTEPDYKDLAFDRRGGKPAQFKSKDYIQGDFELKANYIKKGSVLTIATDGALLKDSMELRITRLQFEGKGDKDIILSQEKYVTFVKHLFSNITPFEETAEKWHKFISSKEKLGDDFTLINLHLL